MARQTSGLRQRVCFDSNKCIRLPQKRLRICFELKQTIDCAARTIRKYSKLKDSRPYSARISRSKPSWILCFAVAALCFSYPLTTIVLQQVGANVSVFNIFIKASFAGAFVLAFLLGVRRFRAMPIGYLAVVVFLSIYSVRLLYDALILGLRLGN